MSTKYTLHGHVAVVVFVKRLHGNNALFTGPRCHVDCTPIWTTNCKSLLSVRSLIPNVTSYFQGCQIARFTAAPVIYIYNVTYIYLSGVDYIRGLSHKSWQLFFCPKQGITRKIQDIRKLAFEWCFMIKSECRTVVGMGQNTDMCLRTWFHYGMDNKLHKTTYESRLSTLKHCSITIIRTSLSRDTGRPARGRSAVDTLS